jgi:hypothetical protein
MCLFEEDNAEILGLWFVVVSLHNCLRTNLRECCTSLKFNPNKSQSYIRTKYENVLCCLFIVFSSTDNTLNIYNLFIFIFIDTRVM